MKDTYPTARVLGIVSAGNFTTPARELVRSRGVELFYVPKEHIINHGKGMVLKLIIRIKLMN